MDIQAPQVIYGALSLVLAVMALRQHDEVVILNGYSIALATVMLDLLLYWGGFFG